MSVKSSGTATRVDKQSKLERLTIVYNMQAPHAYVVPEIAICMQ